MRELIQLLSDERIYKDMAVVLIPLVGTLLVYLYYRYREYREMMVNVVTYGVYCSVHQTINAGDATDYFDSDLYLSEPRNIKAVLRWFKEELHRERSAHGLIDRIAFVEKEDGPVGAITLKDLLSWYTGTPSVVIRPGRKGPALRIKFPHAGLARSKDNLGRSTKGDRLFVRNGQPECILLVSDVATTGTTILESVDFIERAGGHVRAAFVLYDRQEKGPAEDGLMMSAQERLNRKGIRLVSMVRSGELRQAAVNDRHLRRIAEAKGLQCGAQPVV
jgi:orotate phosphoribosyltransferase